MSSDRSIRNLSRYLEAKFRQSLIESEAESKAKRRPAITFSRETGAGAVTISNRLAEVLEEATKEEWVVLDRNFAMEVIKTHNLSEKVAEYMAEAPSSDVTSWVGEFLGLHPPMWTLVEKTNDTIRRLANAGNVILVGRGSHCVTSRLDNVFHFRLVCPVEQRVAWAAKTYEVSPAEARSLIEKKDRERRDYVKQNFDSNIENPLDYHAVFNTGLLSEDEVVRSIAKMVMQRNAPARTR